MKQKIISTLKKELLVIELPENTKTWEYIDGHFFIDDKKTFIKGFSPFHILLGKPYEIREEDAELFVESIWNGFKNYSEPHDGNVGNYQRLVVNTAKESLLSLLESEIDEQFDFKRSLIFKKNKQ